MSTLTWRALHIDPYYDLLFSHPLFNCALDFAEVSQRRFVLVSADHPIVSAISVRHVPGTQQAYCNVYGFMRKADNITACVSSLL